MVYKVIFNQFQPKIVKDYIQGTPYCVKNDKKQQQQQRNE